MANLPLEMESQEVKNLFHDNVGDVTHVELFNDENEKPRGCGLITFPTEELAKKAVQVMHHFSLKRKTKYSVQSKYALLIFFAHFELH